MDNLNLGYNNKACQLLLTNIKVLHENRQCFFITDHSFLVEIDGSHNTFSDVTKTLQMVQALRPVYTCNFCCISSAIFSFWWMWTSKPDTNVQVKNHILQTFVINPLFHICQKKKIAAKIASVNRPLFPSWLVPSNQNGIHKLYLVTMIIIIFLCNVLQNFSKSWRVEENLVIYMHWKQYYIVSLVLFQ